MKKVIGIVGEGPLDQMMIRTAIDHITGERNIYRNIQPEQDANGEFGNGWKGVYRWCQKNASLIPALFTQIKPQLDLLIIQMDGDVSRKEREVHCHCESTLCEHRDKTDPLNCGWIRASTCPVRLPCAEHENTPDGFRQHLKKRIYDLLQGNSDDGRIIITIPCDSTDAWLVAACDDMENCEEILNPWETVISRRKEYHGMRIPGHRKSSVVYRQLVPQVARNWEKVRNRCKFARLLEQDISRWLIALS